MHRRSRVRYDRATALLLATGVTLFAFLAGLGTFGSVSSAAGRTVEHPRLSSAKVPVSAGSARATPTPAPNKAAAKHRLTGTGLSATPSKSSTANPDGSDIAVPVPARSGSGRRIVFDISEQRVWLVDTDGSVLTTYLVSGSVTHNLGPGSYRVYSRSRYANGINDSGTMQYFVRFTRGNNAAIGFHDIPMSNGRPLQSESQLGTPLSHGCIRQARPDAIKLWDFAPVGTSVDVVT